jgi:1-aminocyclopropane-1-carboxylate deaminase/D-cysteine desulfhydrase-like pyridoxal-dependent ACC family enzyme
VTVEARFEESSVRASLGTFPTPVEVRGRIWVKRDDLNATVCGGNKVRALEFLLGAVTPGDTVVTLGSRGSTHVLATAVHAARLGARTIAYTWPQVMNPTALEVSRAILACSTAIETSHTLAALARYKLHRGARCYVPIGGTSPLGILGHIEAGRELAEQIQRGELPTPHTVVVPFGTGGTAAGIAMGLGVAGIRTTVTAVRVVPWIAAPPWRIPGLIRAAGLPAVPIRVDHTAYGGAYGKPLDKGRQAVAEIGLPLDDTYMAKAAAVALALRGPTLLWVTFNARAVPPDLATCDRPAT